jgi:hypothetical protein
MKKKTTLFSALNKKHEEQGVRDVVLFLSSLSSAKAQGLFEFDFVN